ncbi:amino acid adenylation domain-containing protein [Kitasatospora sp. NPDC050463]|uniref:amino acid adenylation domain-containing protein n=1 Tax=Kitasatospora sp. NPDC050463 TaxID=3155786 RepID=UPI0033FF087D
MTASPPAAPFASPSAASAAAPSAAPAPAEDEQPYEDRFDDELPAIAVTGMACRFPGADSTAEFWSLLRAGTEVREEVPAEELRRAGLAGSAPGGPVHVPVRRPFGDPALFDAAAFGMTPAEAALTDPQQRILLELAVHALEDAGIDHAAFPGAIGTVVGLNHSDYLLHHVLAHPEVVATHGWHRVLMGNDRGFTATQIAYRLGLTGPAFAVDCGCSAGLVAVHQAARMLLDYEADAVLAGGAAINPQDLGYEYTPGGIVSPDGRCRPFSAEASGTAFASGAGLVVLRRLEDALADGDRVLAVIRAGAVNNDGRRKSGYTAPSVPGQAELVARVHRLADVGADRIGHLEAHGTATLLGDPIEVAALTEAFRQTTSATGYCVLGSVKANIGHLDSAAGIAGLIKTVLMLRHRELVPTPGSGSTNPHIDFATSPFRIAGESLPWESELPRMAGVSAFGVGGTNAHLLLEEGPVRLPDGDPPRREFDRRRHWLDPRPTGAGAQGAVRPESAATESSAVESQSVEPQSVEPGTRRPEELLSGALEIFRTALGTDEVGPEDDLFVLDGDSLTAQRIAALAGERWGVRIPLGTFLDEPTPVRLAALVAAAPTEQPTEKPAGKPIGAGLADAGPLPVPALLERFLFLDEIPGAAEAYHVPVLAELTGPLDPAALAGALQDVVDRHDGLRLRFHRSEHGPRFDVLPRAGAELPVVDVPDEDALHRAVNDLLGTAIPLDPAPALIARLFRRSAERHVLAVVVHHICADAHSTGVLLRDLYACYARRTGAPAARLPSLEGLFAEHARATDDWTRSAEAERQAAFWSAELADLPERLELPGRARPAERRYRGELLEFELPPRVADQVRALAERRRVTPFTVVLAAFAVLLGRLGTSSDLVVGTPVAGRQHPRTRDLVGNFVNTLPLRLRLDPADDFTALVDRAAGRLRAALDHQELPYELLVRRLGRTADQREAPLFDVLFNMLGGESGPPPAPPGLTAHPVPFERGGSPYELSLDWWFDPDGHLGGRLRYDVDRFGRARVEAWRDCFAHLLDRLTAEPGTPVADWPAEPPALARRTAQALRGPVTEVPEQPVHEVFEDWARREPQRLALAGGGTELTYGRLAEVSAGVAALLAGHGVRPGDRVGLALPKGVPAVAALLGVVRAGAVAVPFDPGLPPARLALMAEDCAPTVVLCERPEAAGFAPPAAAVVLPPLAELTAPSGWNGPSVTGADLVYLTYTSGSTGRPKGIAFPHRALTNLVHWETDGHRRALRWLQFAPLGFDAAFHEVFGALCGGGSLHVVDEETRYDHELLAAFIAGHGVHKAIWPVSLLNSVAAVFEDDTEQFASLREIAATGEQLRLGAAPLAFFAALPDCRLIDNYGPAETHVVTSYTFRGPSTDWPRYAPIGRPLPNTVLRLTDPAGRDVPYGAVGELRIGGVCVAEGYLGLPAQTAERFERSGGTAWYRTGDRARLLPDGELEFLGRADGQVKIRGHRVELAEVDLAIRRVPGVRDVAVVVAGTDGERRLDAYLVTAVPVERVRERLLAELPSALVPATFTVLDALPVNVNGKVVPALLPAPGRPTPTPAPTPAPVSAPTAASAAGPAVGQDGPGGEVLELFRRILERPDLAADDDFFAAGGHSLLAVRVLYGLRERFPAAQGLSVAEFYRCRTAEQVTRRLALRTAGGAAAPGGPRPQALLPDAGPPAALPAGLRAAARPEAVADGKSFVLELGEHPDPRALRLAYRALLRRHPALRLTVAPDGGGLTVRPAETLDDTVPVLDPDPATDLAGQVYRAARAGAPDPRRDPLLRLLLATPPDGPALLGLSLHPLALDGLGLLTLVGELATAYRDPAALGPEDRGFLRQLAWREQLADGEEAKHAAGVWHELLAGHGAPATADALGLPGSPTDPDTRTEPDTWAEPDTEADWAPQAGLHTAVREAGARLGLSPYTLQLTAFALAAARTLGTGAPRIALPWDGRAAAGLEDSVGAFAEVVPLPVTIRPDAPVADSLAAVRALLARIEEARPVPFADLAAADPALAAAGAADLVFNYAWDDGGEQEFAGHALRWVGPEPLQPGQRVHFALVDGPGGFRVRARSRAGGPDAGALTAAYREALYALLFDPSAGRDGRPAATALEGES